MFAIYTRHIQPINNGYWGMHQVMIDFSLKRRQMFISFFANFIAVDHIVAEAGIYPHANKNCWNFYSMKKSMLLSFWNFSLRMLKGCCIGLRINLRIG